MKSIVEFSEYSESKTLEIDEEKGEKFKASLQKLRIRIKDEIKIDSFWYENTDFLLRFIHVKKNDTDKALILLKNYFNLRKKYPKYLKNLIPSAYKFIFELGIQSVLKNRDAMGRKVFMIRIEKWNPQEISLDHLMSSTLLILEEMLSSEESQRNGIVFLADLTGCSLQHFLKFRLNHIRAIISVFIGNFPMKCKGLHSVNEPTWIKRCTSFALPLFSTKLQKRIYFHGKDYSVMHKVLPAEILPHSLGGTLTWDEANDTEFFEKLYSKEVYYQRINSLSESN